MPSARHERLQSLGGGQRACRIETIVPGGGSSGTNCVLPGCAASQKLRTRIAPPGARRQPRTYGSKGRAAPGLPRRVCDDDVGGDAAAGGEAALRGFDRPDFTLPLKGRDFAAGAHLRAPVCRVARGGAEIAEVLLVELRPTCAAALITRMAPGQRILAGDVASLKILKT